MPANQFNHRGLAKKIIIGLMLFCLLVPGHSQAQLPVVDVPARAESIFDRVTKKIWDVLKANSALMWKQAQLYFGTRLAHDAAVFLASGGKGQSSFIWNWSEVKNLADGAAGEYLDNLSQAYFGKSACQPGDLSAMVQIDLSARGLINRAATGVATARREMCEEICARTAVNDPKELEAILPGRVGQSVGAAVDEGVLDEIGALAGGGSDGNLILELGNYSDEAKKLINLINAAEIKIAKEAGDYIWTNANATISSSCGVSGPMLSDAEKLNGFYGCLQTQHGARFSELIKTIFNNDKLKITRWDDIYEIFSTPSKFDALKSAVIGLTTTEKKDLLGSWFLYVGREYKMPAVSVIDLDNIDKVADTKDSMKQLYKLFQETDKLIFARVLAAPPPNVPDLSNIISLLYSGDAADDLSAVSDVDLMFNEAPIYLIKKDFGDYLSGRTGADMLANSKGEKVRLEKIIGAALTDEIFFQAIKVYSLFYQLGQHYGPNMQNLVEQASQFNACVMACERGQMAEPQGACTLGQISKQQGFMGITGINTGFQVGADLGGAGTLGLGGVANTGIGKGQTGQDTSQLGWTSKDLTNLSKIGESGQYALGQVLEIAENSQGLSEEAQRQAEVESQAKDYKPQTSLISGEVMLPGNQVGSRLDSAITDLKNKNNQFTGSILAEMWGTFFNTMIEQFINKLYDKGLDPKLYGGTFNPATGRASYGAGVEAAQAQYSKFKNPSISVGSGMINDELYARFVSGCDKAYGKRKFDECIINEGWKQAIEKNMTLQEAIDAKLVKGDGAFGFIKADGTEPKTQLGEGLSYNSMVILRKYRVIPSSWEVAAVWVRDRALKPSTGKAAPDRVTVEQVMVGFDDKLSPYYGLVNPNWVLKLPAWQCNRLGSGEEVLLEMAMVDTSLSGNRDFDVTISRSDDYCADPVSCIEEKSDGTGCVEFGHCTREREYWRFPSNACSQLYMSCQAYIDPAGQERAWLESTLDVNNKECTEQNGGCLGYLRDYNHSQLTGQLSARVDGLSDNAFTYSPQKFDDQDQSGKEYYEGDFAEPGGLYFAFAGTGTVNGLEISQPISLNNEWRGGVVVINNGSAAGVTGIVRSSDNSRDKIEVDKWIGGVPSGTVQFQIFLPTDPSLIENNLTVNSSGLPQKHNVTDYWPTPTHQWHTVPTLWECNSLGQTCWYERLPGRGEGCKLSADKACVPWQQVEYTKCEITGEGICYFDPAKDRGCNIAANFCDGDPTADETLTPKAKILAGQNPAVSTRPAIFRDRQRYWCGLPGGAGCFVGQDKVLTRDTASPYKYDPYTGPNAATVWYSAEQIIESRDTTLDPQNGICVVGRWEFDSGSGAYKFYAVDGVAEVTAPPAPAGTPATVPLTCSLYRQYNAQATENTVLNNPDQAYYSPGTKRAYLTANAPGCNQSSAGCQQYYGLEFLSDAYNKTYTSDVATTTIKAGDTHSYFLTLEEKKEFTLNLLQEGKNYFSSISNSADFDYSYVDISDIIPSSVIGAHSSADKIEFIGADPKIVPISLDANRRMCSSKDVNCRRYSRSSGGESLAGALDPKKDMCPAMCVGYSRFVETRTKIEDRLLTRVNQGLELYANSPFNRYFIPAEQYSCPASANGCEQFIESVESSVGATTKPKVKLYLKDLRLCVKPDHDNVATYTIIESTASGPTSPVNVKLLQSNFDDSIYYSIVGDQVKISLSSGTVLYSEYHGPCVHMPKQVGDPDSWICDDTAADGQDLIVKNLEQCLTIKPGTTPPEVVSDLTNPNCREYIFFPSGQGAERYPLPYQMPIVASNSCKAFKRGYDTAGAEVYNLDPSDVLWAKGGQFSCAGETEPAQFVSCREYRGQGYQTDGPLTWADFEDLNRETTRWDPSPDTTFNVNGQEGEALNLVENKTYNYNITPIPGNDESRLQFAGKSFKLSLWIKLAAGGSDITFTLKYGSDEKAFPVLLSRPLIKDSKWHYFTFDDLAPEFQPTSLEVKATGTDVAVDNIILETSSSIYLIADQMHFSATTPSISDRVPKQCNTDYAFEPPAYDENAPMPYQLNCGEYKTDRGQIITFKSLALCSAELVGCQAVINTFNTSNPFASTFIPRNETRALAGNINALGYDEYFVPADAIEYMVVDSGAACPLADVGCSLLGAEQKDQAGRVIGFEEHYLIDDPDAYASASAPSACLINEQRCQAFNRKEDGSVALFKEPGPEACTWMRPDAASLETWYKQTPDKKVERCEDYSYSPPDPEQVPPQIPRPKAFCREKYTSRPVLNPGTELTAWCEPGVYSAQQAGQNLVTQENEASDDHNPATVDPLQHVNKLGTCLDYINVLNIDEDGNGPADDAADPKGLNNGINEANVECVVSPAACPVSESQCTLFIDPRLSGIDRYYFEIDDSKVGSGGCGSKVSDDAGCRLFYDTEGQTPLYIASTSWQLGMMSTLCSGNWYTPAGNSSPLCDANRLIKVERDRVCGEWLACQSALILGNKGSTGFGKSESVCLDRKPCDAKSPGGECLNFVDNAQSSFERRQFQDKVVRSRAGKVAGLSDMGFRWNECRKADEIEEVMKGEMCLSGAQCADESKIYTDNTCAPTKLVKDSNTCVNNVCKKGTYTGLNCVNNKDCYADKDLWYCDGDCATHCVNEVKWFCQLVPNVSKDGLKPFDLITETGQVAQIDNGDFEEVNFDLSNDINQAQSPLTVAGGGSINAAGELQLKNIYPAGWEYAACGAGNKACQLVRRFDPPEPDGTRNADVFRGKYSLKLNEKKNFVTQLITNVVPGIPYAISVWLNVAPSDTESGLEIDEQMINWTNGTFTAQAAIGLSCSETGKTTKASNPTHCLKTKSTNNEWQYFSTILTPAPDTYQLLIRLANRSGKKVVFDDVQIRPHLEVSDGTYAAPSCRLYPESNSLNCTARDNQGNMIQGWKGYCLEYDPRGTNPANRQCINWWPIDVILGESNVLGETAEVGYDGQAPLYYCLESKDKEPAFALPRLLCVCKNDVEQTSSSDRNKYEACKVVALASDPKPGFYELSEGDWRLGVNADNFSDGWRVRFLQGSNKDEQRDMKDLQTSGLCLVSQAGLFNGDGNMPDCVRGCMLAESLRGWDSSDKNKGIRVFPRGPEGQDANGPCTWSKSGNNSTSNLADAAKQLEQDYHKIVYFVYSNLKDGNDLQGENEAGCKNKDNGDAIYQLYVDYTSVKATYAGPSDYEIPDVSYQSEPTGMTGKYELPGWTTWVFGPTIKVIPWAWNEQTSKTYFPNKDYWWYRSDRYYTGTEYKPVDNFTNAGYLLVHLLDPIKTKPENHPYYTYDNFDLITRGRLNDEVYPEEMGNKQHERFGMYMIKVPRQVRPQQCQMIAQVVDSAGRNKVWQDKYEKGKKLASPLGYSKDTPQCLPFGAVPYVRWPQDITMFPIDKKTKQKDDVKQSVPLELYHPQNPENDEPAMICKETHRGQGFYACGGLCTVCGGGSNPGDFCQSDDDCKGGGKCGIKSGGGICAAQVKINDTQFKAVAYHTAQTCVWDADCPQGKRCAKDGDKAGTTDPEGDICTNNSDCDGGQCVYFKCYETDSPTPYQIKDDIKQMEQGLSYDPAKSGLRRLQNLFARVDKVWTWVYSNSKTALQIKDRTGVWPGQYNEVEEPNGTWLQEKDVSYLPLSCIRAWTNCGNNPSYSSRISDLCPQYCIDSPGCRYAKVGCIPNGSPFENISSSPNDYRDYDYCVSSEQTCPLDLCKSRPNPTSLLCIPYANPYPNVSQIKVNGVSEGVVTLEEGRRSVTLDLRIDANIEQRPITTVIIDWGDDTKTALAGVKWDNGERSFVHDYSYYKSGSGGPAACKEYEDSSLLDKYECRFRPRIKVVDNWGWCNGAKLSTKSDVIADLDSDADQTKSGTQLYLSSEVTLAYEIANKKESDGYSWGYYGVDCFRQTDARLAAQSWDYFPGIMNVKSSTATRPSDSVPTMSISFVPNKTGSDYYTIGDFLTVSVTCNDDYDVTGCNIDQGAADPRLSCLNNLKQLLVKNCQGEAKSCSASDANCQFIDTASVALNTPSEWSVSGSVTDDASPTAQTRIYNPLSIKKVVMIAGGTPPSISLEFSKDNSITWHTLDYFDGRDNEHKLFSYVDAPRYTARVRCDGGGDDQVKTCAWSENSDSQIIFEAFWCLRDPISNLNGATCTGSLSQTFRRSNDYNSNSGYWSGTLDVEDVGHAKIEIPVNKYIYSPGT